MSVILIRAALETALNSITPAMATSWENYSYAPVAGVPYQAINLLFVQPENPTFGSAFHREVGYMQVTLNYPLQVGPTTAATRAELIRAKFFRGASFTSGGVTVVIHRTPEISSGRVDGDRWAVPVKVFFYSDILS